MSEDTVTAGAPLHGYLSEASKRRFTITAGILGMVFLIGQFALPIAIMVGFMVSAPDIFDIDFFRCSPNHVAVLDSGLWHIETEAAFGDKQDPSTLVRIGINGASTPETMVGLIGTPYLLAGDDRLWLISKTTISYFQDGRLVAIDQPKMLAEFSMPFLFEGMPAVLERWPNELALVVHDGVLWQPRAVLPIVMPAPDCGCGLEWAKAVADDRGVHLFLEFGSSLYYGLWNPGLENEPEWELAAETGEGWSPVLWHGEPAVLGVTPRDDGRKLLGIRRSSDGWDEFLRHGSHSGDLVSAFNISGSDSLIVLVGTSYSSALEALEIEDGTVVREFWIGEQPVATDRFPGFMIVIMATQYGGAILFPLILAVVLSALMRRHRVDAYSNGEQSMSYASLTRRAIAQLVDLAVIAGPVVATSGLFMRMAWMGSLDEPEEFMEIIAGLWPIIAAIGWAILISLTFTFSEGRWGITPGKWLTKIKVLGTDLQPCGFGRALIRNLLKCVDGFFNFVVGIMLIALSENWQRVGDMAARTVVVRKIVPDTHL